MKQIDQLPPVEALDRFTQINNECPQARAVAQVALAEARLERWADARRHLRDALRSREDADVNAKRTELEKALALIERQLARVTVTGGQPGARVRLDAVPVGSLPLDDALMVMPGHHRLEVISASAPGFAQEFDPVAGQVLEIKPPTPAPVVVSPPRPRTPEPAPPSLSTRRKLAYAGFGVATVFLAGGVIASTQWNPVIHHWNYDCLVPVNMTRNMNCPETGRDVQLVQGFTVGGIVAGSVIAAASTGLLLWDLKEERRGSKPVALSCGAGPGVIGAACSGSF